MQQIFQLIYTVIVIISLRERKIWSVDIPPPLPSKDELLKTGVAFLLTDETLRKNHY